VSMQVLISAPQLLALSEDPHTVIFDCRFDLADPQAGREAYAQAHIPGAVYADLNRDLSDMSRAGHGRHPLPNPDQLRLFFQMHGVGERTRVVAYDAREGMFAARLWFLLQWLGHAGGCVLDGGYAAWTALGYKRSTALPLLTPSTGWLSEVNSAWILESNEVARLLARREIALIDARGAPRFRGEVEPIDPVAGHVPGALNRPFNDNLRPDGTFKSVAELRAEWSEIDASAADQTLAVMCGSGVTACHHLLARAHAGLPRAKLYADSWSGWIADPTRAVATSSL